jgi:ABC-type lipoprotein export system ATPase subunit
MVTHDQRAASWGNRTVGMKDGTVVTDEVTS